MFRLVTRKTASFLHRVINTNTRFIHFSVFNVLINSSSFSWIWRTLSVNDRNAVIKYKLNNEVKKLIKTYLILRLNERVALLKVALSSLDL